MIRLVLILAIALAAPLRAATDIVEVTSPGGLTAWLVEEPSIPIVTLNLHFEGGPAIDPPERAGATVLMTGLLDEGAGDRDAQGFAVAREELALRLGFSTNRSAVTVGMTMLSENRAESLALLRSALTEPRFDPEPLERVRGQILSGLRRDQTNPRAILGRAVNRAVYGDHPFARDRDGTPDTVSGLTREDLLAAHARAFTRDRLTIAVVGDITAAELGAPLDDLLGWLPEATVPPPADADLSDAAQTVIIPFASPQSTARFLHTGIDRDDPDYIAAIVVNHILGGGGSLSRLTQEVREERGLTYGISTALQSSSYGSLYGGALSSANATMGQALDLVRAEWARMADEGISQTELDAAKMYLTGAFPLQFNGNGRIARYLIGLQLSRRPIDYIDRRNGLIEALTLEEVNRVAARLLKPEALRVFVIGQPEGVTPTE
ncbi:MAG: pitrilysin family protein [Pseudomonadota bacterium]